MVRSGLYWAAVSDLNYHHLRYFWTVARTGSVTRAAAELRVSQSAISVQLKQLEEQLGHPLFARQGRNLELTEAGRIALGYADAVFRTGDELVQTLRGRSGTGQQMLRIGAITTLSRNFQLALLGPLLHRDPVELIIRSGLMEDLLEELTKHRLDLVLSNLPAPREAPSQWQSFLLREEAASLVSRPELGRGPLRFPQDLEGARMVLPSLHSHLRHGFDRAVDRAGVKLRVVAEVDDMTMLRLMARESHALALVPPIVVRDELERGALVERCRIPEIFETFYATVPKRLFPNPLVQQLLHGHDGSAIGSSEDAPESPSDGTVEP